MRCRPALIAMPAACAAALAALCWPAPGTPAGGGLPQVRIDFPTAGFGDLFGRDRDGEPADVAIRIDEDGAVQAGKASLRGFSDWHHGRTKPSLRIRRKERAGQPGLPEFTELSRPEDPLALCNWLPDQLAGELGLLHEHSQPVRVRLDGRDAGVYLRGLRPGDDLAAAAGRPRGTFWKGDSLGARARLDLFVSPAAWRRSGADDPRAAHALAELLAAVAGAGTAADQQRLAAVFDLEAAARAAAVAVLVGSNHADAAHNHVLFFDPARGRLEPLLWDPNAFGIHAEPTLPVEVARHPLAQRLLQNPWFVHRRNELLWQLLQGPGSPAALVAAADHHLARLGDALAADPEPGRLVLRDGVFRLVPVPAAELPAERARFAEFVQRRGLHLRGHLAGAVVAATGSPGDPGVTRVAVSGTVGVRLTRTDGGPVRSPDGRDASLLLPGLTAQWFPAPQHRGADGRGVPAPHARPAPLFYRVLGRPADLRAHHAFTGEPVPFAAAAPPPVPLHSLHPFDLPPPPPALVRLGPGEVVLDVDRELPAATTLEIEPGTTFAVRGGAVLAARGPVRARGTADAPIVLALRDGRGGGLACIGSAEVSLAHVHVAGEAPAAGGDVPPAIALRGCAAAELTGCRIDRAPGDGLLIVGGRAALRGTWIRGCGGSALVATAAAEVAGEGLDLAHAGTGVVARDGATVALQGGRLRGHVVGCRAERSARGFPGGVVRLAAVSCTDNGQCDVDADAFGTIVLYATAARSAALAPGRVVAGAALPAAPR
ncbi:MAG: hypothetical protein FJ265_12465 [Planctomycetes bacterium]|nr:hypothetical protein [Planctomycetota bacterium]